MSSQSQNQIEFISISAVSRWSSNYTILTNNIVMLNGVQDIAENIKVGDKVAFMDEHGNPIRIEKVATVTQSRFNPTCFGGGCFVYGPNRQEVRVNTLRVGDLVLNTRDEYVRITHAIKTMVGEEIDLYFHQQSGLLVTGYHPVIMSKSEPCDWVFPAECDVFEKKREWTAAVYSFAVEDGAPIYVNNVVVATLAHHLEGPVIGHEYFGGDAVLRDIERISADRYAVIQRFQVQIQRDPETGRVCGLVKKYEYK